MHSFYSVVRRLGLEFERSRPKDNKIDPAVGSAAFGCFIGGELRMINDEIVTLANEIVELDEQAHWRLDLIKQRSAEGVRTINRSQSAHSGYYATLRIQPNFKSNG